MLLLIGYGNPGRGDDGLGPEFAHRIGEIHLPEMEVISDFQLKVEHSLRVAKAKAVVFADAEIGGAPPFSFDRIHASHTEDVTSHNVSPRAVLSLSETLYEASPPAFLLGIAGNRFDHLHDGLSAAAAENLDRAVAFFLDWVASQAAQVESPSLMPHSDGR